MSMLVRGVLALALAAAAATMLWAGGALACPGTGCRPLPLDVEMLGFAAQWRTPALHSLFVNVTGLGSLFVLLPVALYVAWRQTAAAAAFGLASLVGAAVLARVFKELVGRPRPEAFDSLVPLPADGSFPSAHAMQVTALALGLLLAPGRRAGAVEWIAAGCAVALVGLSRIYLQVHYPSDVAFGILAAAAWVAALRVLVGAKENVA